MLEMPAQSGSSKLLSACRQAGLGVLVNNFISLLWTVISKDNKAGIPFCSNHQGVSAPCLLQVAFGVTWLVLLSNDRCLAIFLDNRKLLISHQIFSLCICLPMNETRINH